MFSVSDKKFNNILSQVIDDIPEKYSSHIKNLAFVVEDNPSDEQRKSLHLRRNQTLFGLYEGVPLPQRNGNYNLLLPDKITVFKKPLEAASYDLNSLVANIRQTIWHEVAHYYGLNHDDIHRRERKNT